MPELKRNFMQGRMNKDLDERIIPDGEYRDALNIEVSTAEESSVGTARNVPGNQLLGSLRIDDRFHNTFGIASLDENAPFVYYTPSFGNDFSDSAETVGVVTDEATDKIYSFLSSAIEPEIVAAGNRYSDTPSLTLTTQVQTSSGTTTDSDTVELNSATGVVVGQLVTGTDVVHSTTVTAISGTTITLSKLNSIASGTTLTFSVATKDGYDVDCILETRTAQYQATTQNDKLKAVFVDVYNVYRTPTHIIDQWDVSNSTDVNNKTGPRNEDITILFMSESGSNPSVSSSGNMNYANGIYPGADFQIIDSSGQNILTPDLINPVTLNALGSVKVLKVERKMGGGNPAPRQIQITLNKAIPANLVTAANIASGIHYKFSNERLLNFQTGNKLDYTETNSSGTKLIKDHPTPINNKITGIDIVEGTIYFTDGKTEPKRIDIEKGIAGSNYVTNGNAVINQGAEPALKPMLFETTQLLYKNPISNKFGHLPASSSTNYGLGLNNDKIKNYELEDITVIRRHPLNPPKVDLLRTKRIGLTHNIGLKSASAINSATPIDSSTEITFTVTKNQARDYAFPSFFTGTVDTDNNTKNHSWRVNDILVLNSISYYTPALVFDGSGGTVATDSDSGTRSLKIQITEIASNGTFSQPGASAPTNDYHDTNGAKVVNIERDSEDGFYDFGSGGTSGTNATPPTYTKYNDILTIKGIVVDKNEELNKTPLSQATTSGMQYWEASLEDPNDPVIFKDKFPRFAIRYKYDDNQFSAISPFTEPCFLPKNKYSWNKEEGQNSAMENDVRMIKLRDFITPSTPVDVKQIDILVKFDGENNIYKLESINKGSREWNDDNRNFAKTVLGPNQLVSNSTAADPTIAAAINFNQSLSNEANKFPNFSYSNTRGVFVVKSEKLGGVIPSNQILRPFDAVPIKAKAQCVSANRLIYGNYTLDYDLKTSDGKDVVPRLYYEWRDPQDALRGSFRETAYTNQFNHRHYGSPHKSIKSDRTYTLGISFLDRFGRQSPVITGPESSYTAPVNSAFSTSRLRAKLTLEGGIPSWATHYRYYVKETSNEYYNIALFKAYPAEGDGTSSQNATKSYWLAFHSADRNKIQEDSLLRLKSRAGEGGAYRYADETIRVLAISNEAPKFDSNDPSQNEVEVVIPPKQRKGKFYVKVKASKNLVVGLKGAGEASYLTTNFLGTVLGDYNTPAIFEILPDPDIGLNIFFEIPRTYPIKLTEKNIEDFINFGDFVSCYRTGYDSDGTDNSAPTFTAVDSVPFSHNDPHGTGKKPNELFHLFDNKTKDALEDLTTKILHVRGSQIEDGIQKIGLDAIRNFGVPILTSGATHYLAGTHDGIDPGLIADGNSFSFSLGANAGVYVGNPGVAGEHTSVSSFDRFGSFHVYRLDGTKSTLTINNFKDGLPGSGQLGLGYQSSPNTTFFDNIQSYTATESVHLNSLVFTSENTLPFHNCWHFGNGVESDRIRDDFNAPRLDNGVKASSTAETYGQKTYKHGLIFSGIYNSKTDVNNLNQFIKAEGITKDLNPEYGSIQKLFTRNTNVLAFCENKVLKILSNKDALFNADGNTNVTSNKAVLGTAVPFSGDHGISRNPESFAENEFRCYFTDRDRGAVCRLSMDGITPISEIGMSDYFADELKSAVACVGAFNDKKGEYDLTIHNNLGVDDTDSDTTVDVTKRVQTISFNEKTNSWVSFKSYIIEQGLSINNEYYTLKKGRVFLHSDDAVGGRNNFYGTQYFSSITPIFNDAPGSVKSFQTINYEGTQAQVIANSRTGTTNGAHNATTTLTLTSIPTGLTVGQVVTGDDFTLPESLQLTPVTITAINTGSNQLTLSTAVSIAGLKTVVFSDAEYYNDDAYTGWFVESITTDKQEGQVLEFKEKEGKWFNSISGVATTFTNDVGGGGGTGNIDSQEFSVQGIGRASAISGGTNSGLFYSSEVTAALSVTCQQTVTVTSNTETLIPFDTDFSTYSSFDAGTGKQQVTVCPPEGYSFIDPNSGLTAPFNGSFTAPTVVIDSLTLNGTTTQNTSSSTSQTITDVVTATITLPTGSLSDCIIVQIQWASGYTPNASQTLSVNLAADTDGTALQIYQYYIPFDIDLIWEEGASSEWSLAQPTAIDPNLSTSVLQFGQAMNNAEFALLFPDPLAPSSGADLSCVLNGSWDYTTSSNSFSVVYNASVGNHFVSPVGNQTAQDVLTSFIFPQALGWDTGAIFAPAFSPSQSDFYNQNSGSFGFLQTVSAAFAYSGFLKINWDFTEFDNNGLATQLTVTYTLDFDGLAGSSSPSMSDGFFPFSANPTSSGGSTVPYMNNIQWGTGIVDGNPCDPPSFDPAIIGDMSLIWQPVQDIGGGDEPVIPVDPGGESFTPEDEFEDPISTKEFPITVNVVHQNTGGATSAGVTVQSFATSVQGNSNLDQVVAQCIITPQFGFTFENANITTVGGNAANAPSAGPSVYQEGVSGDTFSGAAANIHKVTTTNLGGSPNQGVQIDFEFESLVVTSAVDITLIIQGSPVTLGGAEIKHRVDTTCNITKDMGDSPATQQIFGNGSSGDLATIAAPASQYSVTSSSNITSLGSHEKHKSIVEGTSSAGVQRTVKTITVQTTSGHRFVVNDPIQGNKFIDVAGAFYTGNTAGNNTEAAANIEQYFNNNMFAGPGVVNHQFELNSSSNSAASYEIDVACTVTNHGAANVQQQLVITVKFEGGGVVETGFLQVFSKTGLRVGNHDSPEFT